MKTKTVKGRETKTPTAIIDGADPAPAPTVDATTLTWTGSLEPGQSVTLTYTVTLDDDAIGVIVRNHASSHATPPGVPPIQPDDVETWHPTPGYTFMKTADPVSGSSVREGDVITIDVPARTLSVELPDEELADRLSQWAPPEPRYQQGVMAKYAAHVQQANDGATTLL